MIVATADNQNTRYVTQSDHAHLAAEILSLWVADGLPEHPHREELVLAVREHDAGWREHDSSPEVDPRSGVPYDFLRLPDARRREIWQRGVQRAMEHGGYVEALILTHAIELHEPLCDDTLHTKPDAAARRLNQAEDDWTSVVGAWKRRRQEIFEQEDIDRETIRRDYRLLALVDRLSLTITSAGAFAAPAGTRLEGSFDAPILAFEALPLKGATTFTFRGRLLPQAAYPDSRAFAGALITARWQQFSVGFRST